MQQLACGRQGRERPAQSWPPCCTPQPETCICWCVQGLGAEIRASEDKPGERTGVGSAETAQRDWSVAQATTWGMRRTEPRYAIEAPLLTHTQRERRGSATAASFSSLLTAGTTPPLQALGACKSWQLPTLRGRAEIWACSFGTDGFTTLVPLLAQCLLDISVDYWCSLAWGGSRFSTCWLCRNVHTEAGQGLC